MYFSIYCLAYAWLCLAFAFFNVTVIHIAEQISAIAVGYFHLRFNSFLYNDNLIYRGGQKLPDSKSKPFNYKRYFVGTCAMAMPPSSHLI